MLRHFREGIRYVRHRQVLVVAVLMVMLIALLGVAMVQLVEPFARHVLDVGAGVYGVMYGGYGAGAIVGGIFMVWGGDSFRRSHLAFAGLLAMAVGDLALGLAPVWVVGFAALFVMGAAQVLTMVSCNTAIQLNVDEGFRGRASSLFTMSFFAAAPIGALDRRFRGGVGRPPGHDDRRGRAPRRAHRVGGDALPVAPPTRPLTAARPHRRRARAPLPTDLDTAGHLVVEPID